MSGASESNSPEGDEEEIEASMNVPNVVVVVVRLPPSLPFLSCNRCCDKARQDCEMTVALNCQQPGRD